MKIAIREEQPEDQASIRRINEAAFGQQAEADIVDNLRSSCGNLLSLVANVEDLAVGHILFSPVIIEAKGDPPEGMGLAPMAVLPEYQRRGIGSLLIREGLERLQSAAVPFVIVLGHPEFYPRFGFEKASYYGLRCQWQGVPEQAFMVLVFDASALQGVSGVVRYREEFNQAM
jgi:putative acetyltransferase